MDPMLKTDGVLWDTVAWMKISELSLSINLHIFKSPHLNTDWFWAWSPLTLDV